MKVEGFIREDDRFPERLHQLLGSGPIKENKLGKEEFAEYRGCFKMEGYFGDF